MNLFNNEPSMYERVLKWIWSTEEKNPFKWYVQKILSFENYKEWKNIIHQKNKITTIE